MVRVPALACVVLLSSGCFADPPAAVDASGGPAETDTDQPTSGQIPTSPTSSSGEGDASSTSGFDDSGSTGSGSTTGGCVGDCECASGCTEGSFCNEGACIPATDCVISWGAVRGDDATAIVTPIADGGLIGPPVVSPTNADFDAAEGDRSPDMLVACGPSVYAAAPSTHSILRLRLNPDFTVSTLQTYALPDPGSLRALTCAGQDRLVAALATGGDATPALRVYPLELDSGDIVGLAGNADAVVVSTDLPFAAVGLSWAPAHSRGYLAFPRPGAEIGLELRSFSLSPGGDLLIQSPVSVGGVGGRVGSLSLTPGDAALVVLGLRDADGNGTGARFDLVDGVPTTTFSQPTGHDTDGWGNAGSIAFLPGGSSPSAVFTGAGRLVLADVSATPAPNELTAVAVPGMGPGGVFLASDGETLLVANRNNVSTVPFANGVVSEEPTAVQPRAMEQYASSVRLDCAMP